MKNSILKNLWYSFPVVNNVDNKKWNLTECEFNSKEFINP